MEPQLKRILTSLIASSAFLSTLSFAPSVFGQSADSVPANVAGEALFLDALPSSLHDTMKALSKALKTVKSQADDASKNKESAVLADQIAALLVHSKNFSPKGMPASSKKAYEQLLDDTAETARSLATAFRANDNAAAKNLIVTLEDQKKQGHGDFKND